MSTSRFFCCYLLTSLKDKCENHTYIGFTVHPKRRIRQHNGEIEGGAKHTSMKRPWEMVLCVYGFPSKRAALYFEWSWQHPEDAKGIRDALRDVKGAGHKMRLKAKVRFLFEMISLPPWNRMPLTVHWFSDKHHSNLEKCKALPRHMNTAIGPFETIYVYRGGLYDPEDPVEDDSSADDESEPYEFDEALGQDTGARDYVTCCLCSVRIETVDDEMKCPHGCEMRSHDRCLALHFLKDDDAEILPTSGACPTCEKPLKWPHLIALKRDECRRSVPSKKGSRRKAVIDNPEVSRRGNALTRKALPAKSPLKRKVVEIDLLDDNSESGLEQLDFGSFDDDEGLPSTQQIHPASKKMRVESSDDGDPDLPSYKVMDINTARTFMPSQSSKLPLSPLDEKNNDLSSDEDVSMISLKDRIAMRKSGSLKASDAKRILLDLDLDDLSPH